jgi:hypothetical protein
MNQRRAFVPDEGDSRDVFLSYNSEDRDEARSLHDDLARRGVRSWIDEAELKPGDRVSEVLDQALQRAPSIAILIGRNGLGPWQRDELEIALAQERRRGARIIPVLLPSAPADLELPSFLTPFHCADLRGGLSDRELDDLVEGIRKARPLESVRPRQQPASNAWRWVVVAVALLGVGLFVTIDAWSAHRPPPVRAMGRFSSHAAVARWSDILHAAGSASLRDLEARTNGLRGLSRDRPIDLVARGEPPVRVYQWVLPFTDPDAIVPTASELARWLDRDAGQALAPPRIDAAQALAFAPGFEVPGDVLARLREEVRLAPPEDAQRERLAIVMPAGLGSFLPSLNADAAPTFERAGLGPSVSVLSSIARLVRDLPTRAEVLFGDETVLRVRVALDPEHREKLVGPEGLLSRRFVPAEIPGLVMRAVARVEWTPWLRAELEPRLRATTAVGEPSASLLVEWLGTSTESTHFEIELLLLATETGFASAVRLSTWPRSPAEALVHRTFTESFDAIADTWTTMEGDQAIVWAGSRERPRRIDAFAAVADGVVTLGLGPVDQIVAQTIVAPRDIERTTVFAALEAFVPPTTALTWTAGPAPAPPETPSAEPRFSAYCWSDGPRLAARIRFGTDDLLAMVRALR